MGKGRSLSAAIAALAICAVCACGKGEEPAAEAAEAAPAENNSYASLYLGEIEQLRNTGQADSFALINVDGDDIPELAASDSKGSYEHDNVFLYTVYNEEIRLLESGMSTLDGYFLDYSEGRNIIKTGSGMAGLYNNHYSMIRNGGLEPVLSGTYKDVYIDPDEEVYYMINDEEVSEREYTEKIQEIEEKYMPFTGITAEGLKPGGTYAVTVTDTESDTGSDTELKPYMTYEEISDELEKTARE